MRRIRILVLSLLILASCCAAVIRRLPAQESARWVDERTAGPFFCHANFSLEGRSELLREMNRLQQDLVDVLEVQPAREPVHLFLFERKATYERYLQLYFPEVPKRRALYIKARGPGMVFAHLSNDFEIDVRHESTHALLHASLPMVPLWLDEGLAEYFEMASDQRIRGHAHLKATTWRLRLGRSIRIEDLEELADLSDMNQTHYQQAWAWVHFMLHGPAAAGDELRRYLSDIEAHTPPGKLSTRLRRRIPNLEAQFRDHFLNM